MSKEPEEGSSQVVLKMTPDQAVSVIRALDFFARMGLGQMRAIAHQVRHGGIPFNRDSAQGGAVDGDEVSKRCEAIDDLCSGISRQLGFTPNASYGMGNPQVPMAARRAYEVSKVLDKALAMHRDPAPAFRGVNYDGLIVRYTGDPAPVATVVTVTPAEMSSAAILENIRIAIPFADATAYRVPVAIINAVTAYGDARADGDVVLGGKRLADCIRAVREALSCTPSSIRMTSDRPTAPGWYWYALPGVPGEWAMQPVLVYLHEGELYVCRDVVMQDDPEEGFLLSECSTETLWSSEPIPAPKI